MEEEKENAIESGKTKVKPSRLLFACMHYRAHPRHYRSEYVRGYLHRLADVYSLPGWSQLVIPYIYLVNLYYQRAIYKKRTRTSLYPSNIFQFVRFMRFVFPIIVPSSLTTPLSLGEGSGVRLYFTTIFPLALLPLTEYT